MATLAIVLSTKAEDMWEYTAAMGRKISLGVRYMFPYVNDKKSWPFKEDVMFYEFWPVAHPLLLFSALHDGRMDDFKVWKRLEHFPTN